MRGKLFTRDYLDEGITETTACPEQDRFRHGFAAVECKRWQRDLDGP